MKIKVFLLKDLMEEVSCLTWLKLEIFLANKIIPNGL